MHTMELADFAIQLQVFEKLVLADVGIAIDFDKESVTCAVSRESKKLLHLPKGSSFKQEEQIVQGINDDPFVLQEPPLFHYLTYVH